MKVAVIGTGRVGSATALLLMKIPVITELLLWNRTPEKAEHLRMDILGGFPFAGKKLQIAKEEEVNQADLLVITAGLFNAPDGKSLAEANKTAFKELLQHFQPKPGAKIIVIGTPVDDLAFLTAQHWEHISKHSIIGFGGQLDTNRLKYAIMQDQNNFTLALENVHFIGEHGSNGIPVFRQDVQDKKKVEDTAKNYYSLFLASQNASLFGTAFELAKLVDALLHEEMQTLDVSHYNEEHELYLPWPCTINNQGIQKPLPLQLTEAEQNALKTLIESKKKK